MQSCDDLGIFVRVIVWWLRDLDRPIVRWLRDLDRPFVQWLRDPDRPIVQWLRNLDRPIVLWLRDLDCPIVRWLRDLSVRLFSYSWDVIFRLSPRLSLLPIGSSDLQTQSSVFFRNDIFFRLVCTIFRRDLPSFSAMISSSNWVIRSSGFCWASDFKQRPSLFDY